MVDRAILYHNVYEVLEVVGIVFGIYVIYEHYKNKNYAGMHIVFTILAISFLLHASVRFQRQEYEGKKKIVKALEEEEVL